MLAGAAALLLSVPLAACSAGLSGAGSDSIGIPSPSPESMMVEPARDATGGISQEEASSFNAGTQSRSVIQTGELSIEVDDARAAADRVAETAQDLGGRVDQKTVSGSDATRANLMIRVPADRFDEAFVRLGEIGTIANETRSASDVTMQHVDLQARVAALEESIERLTTLMGGAANTGELIEAENALSQRQAELDSLNAQLTALEDQVGESSIWVTLYVAGPLAVGGPSNFWEGLLAGIQGMGAFAAGAMVVLGVLLPWLIVLAVIALAIILPIRGARRKRRAQRQTLAQQAVPQAMPAPQPADPPAPQPADSPQPPPGY